MNDVDRILARAQVGRYVLGHYPAVAFLLIVDALRRAAKAQSDREYRESNSVHISAQRKESYRENPDPAKRRANLRYALKADEIKDGLRNKYNADPEVRQKKLKQAELWRLEHPERYSENMMQFRRRNKRYPVETRPRPEFCECCGKPPGKRALHLDHCHSTGVFRGWLCHNCNVGIGHLGDSEDGLVKAIAYLHRAYGARS